MDKHYSQIEHFPIFSAYFYGKSSYRYLIGLYLKDDSHRILWDVAVCLVQCLVVQSIEAAAYSNIALSET